MNHSNTIDKIFLSFIYLPVLPISLLLAMWWISYALLPQSVIPITSIAGLIIGCLLNMVIIPNLLKRGYDLHVGFLIFVYSFYMIGIFGFFMGVPIFNIIPGIIAGFYFGRREKQGLTEIKAQKFCLAFLVLICIASALIALSDPYTAGNLRGMLNLPFELTIGHIWAIVIIGGGLLFGLQYTGYNFAKKIALKLK